MDRLPFLFLRNNHERLVNVDKNYQSTIFISVSGLRNTAYSQFYIQQDSQQGTTRTAYLRTNVTFDYDRPGTKENR